MPPSPQVRARRGRGGSRSARGAGSRAGSGARAGRPAGTSSAIPIAKSPMTRGARPAARRPCSATWTRGLATRATRRRAGRVEEVGQRHVLGALDEAPRAEELVEEHAGARPARRGPSAACCRFPGGRRRVSPVSVGRSTYASSKREVELVLRLARRAARRIVARLAMILNSRSPSLRRRSSSTSRGRPPRRTGRTRTGRSRASPGGPRP